jgi:chromosome segregation ATPase
MTDQNVIDLVKLVQRAYSSVGWVREEELCKILEEAVSLANNIEDDENNYRYFLLNELKEDLMRLEKGILAKKDQIRQKRLECKNFKQEWLKPMIRGTIETMEETLKSLEERREIIKERLDTLKSDLENAD